MDVASAFLQAIRDSPDDDAPRLSYADWLEAECDDPPHVARAEFIRLDCSLAAMRASDPRHEALAGRRRQLLKQFEKVWRKPLPSWARECEYERGFINRVSASPRRLLSGGGSLWEYEPVSEVRLYDRVPDVLKCLAEPLLANARKLWIHAYADDEDPSPDVVAEAVAATPHLTGVADLEFWGTDLSDRAAEALASSRTLRLRRLNLQDHDFSAAGYRALARSPILDGIEELDLGAHSYLGPSVHKSRARTLGNAGVEALAQSPHLIRLRKLILPQNGIGPDGVKALARSRHLKHLDTLDLTWNPVGPDGVKALARSRGLQALSELDLSDARINDEALQVLAQSPLLSRLRSLFLEHNPITGRGLFALLNSPHFTGLARLDLDHTQVTDATVKALVESPDAAQLTHLDLSWTRLTDRGLEALAASPHLSDLRDLRLEGLMHGNRPGCHLAGGRPLNGPGPRAIGESPYLENLDVLILYWVSPAEKRRLKKRFGKRCEVYTA